MSKLRGPRVRSVFIPPPVSLPPLRLAELDQRVETLLVRWRPLSDDPNGLRDDLYQLVEWALDDPRPDCPVLEYQAEGCL